MSRHCLLISHDFVKCLLFFLLCSFFCHDGNWVIEPDSAVRICVKCATTKTKDILKTRILYLLEPSFQINSFEKYLSSETMNLKTSVYSLRFGCHLPIQSVTPKLSVFPNLIINRVATAQGISDRHFPIKNTFLYRELTSNTGDFKV